MTVRVVTDSGCDLPNSAVEASSVTVVPLTIRFGDEEFVNRGDLTTAEFWAKCAASPVLPSTAAPSPGQFEMEYRRLAAEGASGIVVVSLSSALSATMQSATLAAAAVADAIRVEVVDSRSVSLGTGLMVLAAANAAQLGATVDEVAALARDLVGRTHLWGALDTAQSHSTRIMLVDGKGRVRRHFLATEKEEFDALLAGISAVYQEGS